MRILTSGIRSGLGKHIYERLGGISWTRQTSVGERGEIRCTGVDVIVHCAGSSRQPVDSESLYGYLADNVLLTEELASVPHQKFILISSVDVYPKGSGLRSENMTFLVDEVNGIYGTTKLMSEAIVRELCPNHIILRCTALLGKHSRKNSLLRIIEEESCVLTLTGDSRFNYVLLSDVSDFIRFALDRDVEGIYNVACSQNVTLSRAADILGKKVHFGQFHYDVGEIDNQKISSIFPAFNKTSEDAIAEFVRARLVRR